MLIDNATQTRWWIPPPGPDESLRSTLNRAAAVYKHTPERLWDSLHLNDSRPSGPIDTPSSAALRRMALALGISPTWLYPHRETDTPWRMPAPLRRNFCALCWNRDLAAGRPLRMLRSWNHVLRTRCSIHDFPLSHAPSDWATNDHRHHYPIPSLTTQDLKVLDLIETFGVALEQSLFFGAPWPSGWSGTPSMARTILIRVNFSETKIKDFSATNAIYPESDGLWALVRGTRLRQEPATRVCWESFRSMPDPANRRAALWLAAWEFVPGLCKELSPRVWHGASGTNYYRDRWKNELPSGTSSRPMPLNSTSWDGVLMDNKRRLAERRRQAKK